MARVSLAPINVDRLTSSAVNAVRAPLRVTVRWPASVRSLCGASQPRGSKGDPVLWQDVLEVLDGLEKVSARYWVAGGWGVDLLVGSETRAHRDLDLAVDADDYETCMITLDELGYSIETNWLPVRVEVVGQVERWVDVHPVRFDGEGPGIQGDPEGVHFLYPLTAFTTGRLRGRAVPCLSIEQQELFHSGYDLRPQDEHDLRLAVRVASVADRLAGRRRMTRGHTPQRSVRVLTSRPT